MKLIVLFGPPAVGKMTVGYELERLTGFRLFHNHMTIDPVLRFFDFGTTPFKGLLTNRVRMIGQLWECEDDAVCGANAEEDEETDGLLRPSVVSISPSA